MIICQTASCIILYFIIFIIQYIHYHIRPCLIIPHDTVNVFVYTSRYTTVFIATERNSIGIPTFYTYPYTITTPLSSVSLHDLHVSRWVPRKQRNVTLKRSIRRAVLLNSPRFGGPCRGLAFCELHVASGFQMWPYKRFFGFELVFLCIYKHLVTNKLVIFTSSNSHPSFFSKPTPQPFLKKKNTHPPACPTTPWALFEDSLGIVLYAAAQWPIFDFLHRLSLRRSVDDDLPSVEDVEEDPEVRGVFRCFFCDWRRYLRYLEWRTWDFLTMHFCKRGTKLCWISGFQWNLNDSLIFDPGSLGKMDPELRSIFFKMGWWKTTN